MDPSATAPRVASKGGMATAILTLGLAVLFVYIPTPGDYWIGFDNETLIRQQPRVQALVLEGEARRDALVEMFTTPHGDLYQPLLSLSFAVDHALFGWNRAGFHAHSLLLHLSGCSGGSCIRSTTAHESRSHDLGNHGFEPRPGGGARGTGPSRPGLG